MQTPPMILLCLDLKLSNVFPAFDNSAARNVKIVECPSAIRQFSKIQKLVAPIQLAVVPNSVPNAKNAPSLALFDRVKDGAFNCYILLLQFNSQSSRR